VKNLDDWNPLRIPVKLVDGQWEFLYGGGLPIKNGAVGDLVVDRDAVEDKLFVAQLTRTSKHKVLEAGTDLLVAVTVKPEPSLSPELMKCLLPIKAPELQLGDAYYHSLRSPQTRFVRVWVVEPTARQLRRAPDETGGVWLHLKGLETTGITTSAIRLPDVVFKEPAESLNHAFTLLSERFEPWRMSHTGNVYYRVLYREANNKWYPLNVLRHAQLAKEEHQLIHEHWARIALQLNLKLKT